MRIIKFRAWDYTHSRMVYADGNFTTDEDGLKWLEENNLIQQP